MPTELLLETTEVAYRTVKVGDLDIFCKASPRYGTFRARGGSESDCDTDARIPQETHR